MQIMIDIPEESFNAIKNGCFAFDDDIHDLFSWISDGIPLSKGKWIRRHYITADKTFDMYMCSNCKEEFSYDAETGVSIHQYDCCPNCGADMRGDINADSY